MGQTVTFRALRDNEEDLGYQVLTGNVAWQGKTGIMLWDRSLPREVYHSRQLRGENYGLFVDGSLAAIVCLVQGVPSYWSEVAADPGAMWLCTLAVADDFHGRGIGKLAVDRSLSLLREAGHQVVWLDCTAGFLERFYKSLDFGAVTRGRKFIPHAGRPLDCVLFKKVLI